MKTNRSLSVLLAAAAAVSPSLISLSQASEPANIQDCLPDVVHKSIVPPDVRAVFDQSKALLNNKQSLNVEHGME